MAASSLPKAMRSQTSRSQANDHSLRSRTQCPTPPASDDSAMDGNDQRDILSSAVRSPSLRGTVPRRELRKGEQQLTPLYKKGSETGNDDNDCSSTYSVTRSMSLESHVRSQHAQPHEHYPIPTPGLAAVESKSNDSKLDLKRHHQKSKKVDARGRYTDFLSDLNPEDRLVLHDVLVDKNKPSLVSKLPVDVQEGLRNLQNAVDSSQPGQWFLDLTKCYMTELGKSKKEKRHPQKQFSIADMRGDGVIRCLKGKLSPNAFEDLKELPRKVKGHKPQARFYVHEIAYAAECVGLRIPNNKDTRGGGISHLCDRIGCMKPEHLEAAWSHAENIARRGCTGIYLIVQRDHIVDVDPCEHADKSGDMEKQLKTSCQKIRIKYLGQDEVQRIVKIEKEHVSMVSGKKRKWDNSCSSLPSSSPGLAVVPSRKRKVEGRPKCSDPSCMISVEISNDR